MVGLYQEFKKDGFVVLAVDIQEPLTVVGNFVNKNKVPFPVLLDRDGSTSKKYGVRFQPDHFLVDKKGELIGKAPGAKNWTSPKMRHLIRFLLDRG